MPQGGNLIHGLSVVVDATRHVLALFPKGRVDPLCLTGAHCVGWGQLWLAFLSSGTALNYEAPLCPAIAPGMAGSCMRIA